jgi:nucleoside-diphosphate-sugar epimerase
LKALVTGSSGFIGENLVKRLLQSGNSVTGLDIITNSQLESLKNFNFVQCDMNKDDFFEHLDLDFDYIFHLAAINGTSNFYDNPYEVLVAAIRPTLNLLDWLKKVEISPVLFHAGTSESYAGIFELLSFKIPTPENVPLVVSDILNPRWSYAAAKIASEAAVVNFCRMNGLPWIIGRFHNVYGPGMSDKHFIMEFTKRLMSGKVEVYGGEHTRAFLYIENAVEILIRLVCEKRAHNKVVNIGSNEEVQVLEVATIIARMLDNYQQIQVYPAPIGSVLRRCPDTELLKSLIQVPDEPTLEDGIRKTLRYFNLL